MTMRWFDPLKVDKKKNVTVAVQDDGSLIAPVWSALIHVMSACKCDPNLVWVFLSVPISPVSFHALFLSPTPTPNTWPLLLLSLPIEGKLVRMYCLREESMFNRIKNKRIKIYSSKTNRSIVFKYQYRIMWNGNDHLCLINIYED